MVYAYTTPALVQAELQSSTQFSYSTLPTDATVQEWVYEESAYINGLANTVFGSTLHQSVYVDYDGSDDLFMEYSPLLGVTSVEYNEYPIGSSLGSSWVTKTAETHYTTYSDRGVIRILRLNWNPDDGDKRIRVTYTSGYTEIPQEVAKLATKLVALRCLETLIMKNINERNDGGSVSVGSISIVEPSSYGVNSLKQLRNDIDTLKREVLTKKFTPFRFLHI